MNKPELLAILAEKLGYLEAFQELKDQGDLGPEVEARMTALSKEINELNQRIEAMNGDD